MDRKRKVKIFIVLGIVIVILAVLIFMFVKIFKKNNTNLYSYQIFQGSEYDSVAPNKSIAAINATLIFQRRGQTKTFSVKNLLTGLQHTVYTVTSPNIQFEKIESANWSPTNRFLYVFMDDMGQRNILFFQTDGRFTDAEYYLVPIPLLKGQNIASADWLDGDTLIVKVFQSSPPKHYSYSVDFDDSTGTVSLVN